MRFEVPLIITVEADTREDAVNEASDLADSIAEVFATDCTAIVSDHHELLARLGIDPEGNDMSTDEITITLTRKQLDRIDRVLADAASGHRSTAKSTAWAFDRSLAQSDLDRAVRYAQNGGRL